MWDQSVAGIDPIYYLDGVAQTPTSATPSAGGTKRNDPTCILQFFNGFVFNLDLSPNGGVIWNVGFWDGLLSPEEVKSLATGMPPSSIPENLICSIPLDDTTIFEETNQTKINSATSGYVKSGLIYTRANVK